MPDDPVRLRVDGAQLQHLGDADGKAVALFACRIAEAGRRIAQEAPLPAFLHPGRCMIGRQFVPMHLERRQVIACVGKTEIAGFLHEQAPAGHPQPELFLLVRVDGEAVGLLAIALEEPRLGLADIHDFEEGRIGQELDIFVRARRGRGDEFEPHPVEQPHEFPEGLGPAKTAQYRSLVEAGGGKTARIELAVTHRLVIGDIELAIGRAFDAPDKAQVGHPLRPPIRPGAQFCPLRIAHRRVLACRQRPRIGQKFAAHTQGRHHQALAAKTGDDNAQDFQLHKGLAQPEGREQRPPPAQAGPFDHGLLVRAQQRIDLIVLDDETRNRRPGHLGGKKIFVAEGHIHAAVSIDEDAVSQRVCAISWGVLL